MSSIKALSPDYPEVPLEEEESSCTADSCINDTLARATRGWRVRCRTTVIKPGPTVAGVANLAPQIDRAVETKPPVVSSIRGSVVEPELRGATTSPPAEEPDPPSVTKGEVLVPVIRKVRSS